LLSLSRPRQKGEASLRVSGDNDAVHEGQDGGDVLCSTWWELMASPTRSNECSMLELPWVVLGDFNEAMWSFEHFPRVIVQSGKWLIFMMPLMIVTLWIWVL
jgi:hypothetical protein